MHINRGLVFWGIALITAGAVALAIQSGTIDAAAARELWRFWPVVLIVIGLSIIAARTPLALLVTILAGLTVGGFAGTFVAGWPEGIGFGCSGTADQSRTETGTFSGSAEVDLEFNCGDLEVTTGDAGGWEVTASYASDAEPEISSANDSLSVRAEGAPWFTDRRQEWEVTVPTDVDLALKVDANAASSRLDLAGARLTELNLSANAGDVLLDLTGAEVRDLEVDVNAGSASIVVGEGTSGNGSLSVNAGSLELCVADGLVVAITLDDENITFGHNLDESGLDRSGDTWQTGDGTPDLVLDVDGNAGSFTLNPEEGCE